MRVSSASPAGASDDRVDGAAALLRSVVQGALEMDETEKLPSLAVGASLGSTIHVGARGWADVGRRHPATIETAYRISSLSKIFVGIAVVQLRDAGLLDLDDSVPVLLRHVNVRKRDRSWPDPTIRQCLTHTSGIPDYRRRRDLLRYGRDYTSSAGKSLSDFFRCGLTCAVQPGTSWGYSSQAYALLGVLIEDVTGMPFVRYVEESILRPLGLDSVTFSSAEVRHPATGYVDRFGELRALAVRDSALVPSVGAWASAADLTKLGAWLAGGIPAEPVLSAASRDELMDEHYQPDAQAPGWTLCLSLMATRAGTMGWMNGGAPGQSSTLCVMRDHHVSVALLTNLNAIELPIAAARNAALEALTGYLPRPDNGNRQTSTQAGEPAKGVHCSAVVGPAGEGPIDYTGKGYRIRIRDGVVSLRPLRGPGRVDGIQAVRTGNEVRFRVPGRADEDGVPFLIDGVPFLVTLDDRMRPTSVVVLGHNKMLRRSGWTRLKLLAAPTVEWALGVVGAIQERWPQRNQWQLAERGADQ